MGAVLHTALDYHSNQHWVICLLAAEDIWLQINQGQEKVI
jgi:hypothetical protein